MAGPWEKYGAQTKPANQMLPGQLQGQGLNNAGQATANTKNAATLPYDIRSARAQAEKAEIDTRNARDQYNAAHPPVGTSGLYGQDFLKTLSTSDQNMIKALSEGRLAFPQGAALRAPFWQEKLSQVAQYDPTFDATDFNARAKGRSNAISGKLGQSNNALNTAIGHLGQLAGQVGGTASHQGFPLATTVNWVENKFERGMGDPGVTNFEDTASKLADELEAVYRNGGGAEQGVARQLRNLDVNASFDQKVGVIHNAMDLLASKMAANISQYNFGTGGKPTWDMLDPHAKAVLDQYAPNIRDKYFASPTKAPAAPSLPGTPPPSGPGFVPPPTGPTNDSLTSSSGGFDDRPDPESAAFWEDAARNRVPYRTALKQWQSDVKVRGLQVTEPPPPGAYREAGAYMHDPRTSGIEYHPFQSTIHTPLPWVNLGGADKVSNWISRSVPGAFAGHFFNDATAGTPERLAGDEGAYFDAVSRKEHPTASTLGDIGGTVAGAYTTNKLLGPALSKIPGPVGNFLNASKLANNPLSAELAPGVATARQGLTTDMVFGGTSGAIQNPDHPLLGAAAGATAMGGGNLLGRYTLGPALAAAGETAPGQFLANTALKGATKLRDIFGRGGGSVPPRFSPPAALDPGQSLFVNQGGKTLGDITGKMTEARDLGLPFAFADAHPKLRVLTGSAVRKSPDVRTLAENTVGPRQMGQAERAIGLIDQHLAPVGDVPAIKAEALAQAGKKSAPFYARAKSKPPPELAREPGLSGILARPSAEQGLRRGYRIALDEGSNPAELSFATGPNGETVINGNPTWQTLHYVRRGLDEEIAGAIDPVTGKVKPGMSDTQGAMIRLRGDLDREIGRINPTFKQADAVYADYARQGSAAERGAKATGIRVTPEHAARAVTSAGDNLPSFQRGYASTLADTVERTRLARDPNETIYGSPAQQSKMGIVFPHGADAFGRARALESDMSKTAQETLGGSPTQARGEADRLFESPGLDSAIELGSMALTGTPPKGLIMRGLRSLGDMHNLGMRGTKEKADQIGPLLLNMDPNANLLTLADLIKQSAARQRYVNSSRTLGGLIGAPLTYGALNR